VATRAAASAPLIHPSADVDPQATIAEGTVIWHLAQVRELAHNGAHSVLGRGAYVGPSVIIGKNSKLQNYALVYEPAVLEEGVFIGPAAVLTNDLHPRAMNPDGTLKTGEDWHMVGVTVRAGGSVGARAVCIAPVTIGRWAMVAAGAVVTHDVPDFALVAGVPARQVGWVGRAGFKLVASPDDGVWICPASGERYLLVDGAMHLEEGGA
jgi:acetyltransferase-like isoleucine patch superfamily enzyme